MLSKNDIKFIRSLSRPKNRMIHSSFVAEGSKIIKELLASGFKTSKIFTLESSKNELPENSILVKTKQLEQISFLKNPQDALAIFERRDTTLKGNEDLGDICLVCDRVQDPGNLGTIVRIADWFGIDSLVCSSDTADIYNPKVVQSTMGSMGRVKVLYGELMPWLESKKKDYDIVSTDLNGQNLYKTEIKKPCMLILGNEAKGVSQNVLNLSHKLVKIPSYGNAESLNVAVSAGILCAELRRN